MPSYVYDTESDGFVEEATRLWCIVLKDIETNEIFEFDDSTRFKSIINGLNQLESANTIIAHNQIDHDIPLILKLYPNFCPVGKVLDTLILSQLLHPDRLNGHSLGQYGKELGQLKPEHTDWSQFSPEMLHRCVEDVEINQLVYNQLMEEAYEPVTGLKYSELFM